MRYCNLDLAFGAFGQCLRKQVRLGEVAVKQDKPRGRYILVKLRQEAGKHFVFAQFGHMAGEERAMTPILPAANEERLDAHDAVAVRQREDVGIANALGIDRL